MRMVSKILTLLPAAFICSIVAASLVVPFAVLLTESISWPLALLVTTLVSAIGTAWIGTLRARDGTRSRLLVVVGVSEAIAIALAPVLLWTSRLDVAGLFGLVLPLVCCLFVVAIGASWAAEQYRAAGWQHGRDAAVTIGLVSLLPVIVSAAVWLQPRLRGACDSDKQAVLNEFPAYGGLQHPLPVSRPGLCSVSYTTAASEAQVLAYYTEQLLAHGWRMDEPPKEGPPGSLSARRGSLLYSVDYAPGGHLTISLGW